MADDIEAFLRRAAQRRKEQAGRKAAQTPKPRPEYSDSRAERQVRPQDIVMDVEVVEEPIVIGQMTNRHLEGEHLAQAVGMADEKMDAHIQKVFDHQVSQLADPAPFDAGQALSQGDIAKTLIAMLQSAQGLQQAILLREIIDRPEHRWE